MICSCKIVEPVDDRDNLVSELASTLRSFSRILHGDHGARPGHNKPQSFLILHYMHHNLGGQQVPLGDLVTNLGVSRPALTQFMNELENDGLIVRHRDKTDRRTILVSLTEKGREAFKPNYHHGIAKIQKVISCLGEDEVKQLVNLMKRAMDCLQERGTPDA